MTDLWEHIDLCSGVGGFSLGFQYAKLSEPILFCEIDEYCQKVLKKHWPNVPICNDVKELANDTNAFIPRPRGRKRILTGGYPCQSFSQAGKRRGWEDSRAIWPFIFRIVQQERPNVCVFENVAGHISLGLDEVLHDLEGESYTTRTFVLPAEACGAPHRRDRLWIIARNVGNANSRRCKERVYQSETVPRALSASTDVADPDRSMRSGDRTIGQSGENGNRGLHPTKEEQATHDIRSEVVGCDTMGRKTGVADQQPTKGKQAAQQRLGRILDGLSAWLDEPVDIPRVASGQKDRTHRLKALGNAIVPQIAQRIGIAIRESF